MRDHSQSGELLLGVVVQILSDAALLVLGDLQDLLLQFSALRDFGVQLIVGGGKLRGACGHALFQVLVEPAQFLLRSLTCIGNVPFRRGDSDHISIFVQQRRGRQPDVQQPAVFRHLLDFVRFRRCLLGNMMNVLQVGRLALSAVG